jgi:hypothetical protein
MIQYCDRRSLETGVVPFHKTVEFVGARWTWLVSDHGVPCLAKSRKFTCSSPPSCRTAPTWRSSCCRSHLVMIPFSLAKCSDLLRRKLISIQRDLLSTTSVPRFSLYRLCEIGTRSVWMRSRMFRAGDCVSNVGERTILPCAQRVHSSRALGKSFPFADKNLISFAPINLFLSSLHFNVKRIDRKLQWSNRTCSLIRESVTESILPRRLSSSSGVECEWSRVRVLNIKVLTAEL